MRPHAPDGDMPGRPVGPGLERYRLGRLLGRGGMGEVYLARDLDLERDVAIKFVSSDKAIDGDARRRLLREAQAAARLDHPSICTVHETGETADGRPFIVMQYVDGEPLSTRLERGPLPAREALLLAAQAADALGAAHRQHIVHRDLKPGNVMLMPNGRLKLLDFGIAKHLVRSGDGGESPTSSGATSTGSIIGTPAYMSPEQVQQRRVDGRSDLFSLGALLYECLTGRRAFDGPTAYEVVAAVLHLHPPPPSSLRSDLTDRHDELCARLLAKEPDDRFQSAEEVVGAIRLLLPDTSRTRMPTVPGSRDRWHDRVRRRVSRKTALAALAMLAAFVVIWQLTRPTPLPAVPAMADQWYRRGTEDIREGAYESGRRAIRQAIGLFPQHALAFARLADAEAELDDQGAAQQALLRVSALVPNESRLPEVERLRLQGIRTLVLREVDEAVEVYRRLVDRHPNDARAWLDLGRAQEAAGRHGDARSSYRQAIAQDSQYAAAYLRLAELEGLQARKAAALEAFAEAERLYRAASNREGEAEVLLRRGSMLDAAGDFKAARVDLERALQLADSMESTYQQVRARLALSSVTATEGRFEEAERMTSAAIQEAVAAGLHTTAADGLVDLAATLLYLDKSAEAAAHLERALQLAEHRGAGRTAMRARLQMAALHESANRPKEALAAVESILPFVRTNRYRRYELVALAIASRAHQRLDSLDHAQTMAEEVLRVAERLDDQGQIALGAANLASVTTALGDYPKALRLRERAEAIHRQQGDESSLPYDLANRADVLIRLGRGADAEAPLAELEAGIAAARGAFPSQRRRAAYLRALAAATSLDCQEVRAHLGAVGAARDPTDSAGVLGTALETYCVTRLRSRSDSADGGTAPVPTLLRDRQYWLALGALNRHSADQALREASRGLTVLATLQNDELRWRLAAIAAAAARDLRDGQKAAEMASQARSALGRLRATWKSAVDLYERRPDVVYVKQRAGIP
jgi:tetratricopeptide (TPR) repeat protein